MAALASVVALALSIVGGGAVDGSSELAARGVGAPRYLCVAGVAVLCASFSVDFYHIWVVLPRQAAALAAVMTIAPTVAPKADRVGTRALNGGAARGVASVAVAAAILTIPTMMVVER